MKGGNNSEIATEEEEVFYHNIGIYISFLIHTYVL